MGSVSGVLHGRLLGKGRRARAVLVGSCGYVVVVQKSSFQVGQPWVLAAAWPLRPAGHSITFPNVTQTSKHPSSQGSQEANRSALSSTVHQVLPLHGATLPRRLRTIPILHVRSNSRLAAAEVPFPGSWFWSKELSSEVMIGPITSRGCMASRRLPLHTALQESGRLEGHKTLQITCKCYC